MDALAVLQCQVAAKTLEGIPGIPEDKQAQAIKSVRTNLTRLLVGQGWAKGRKGPKASSDKAEGETEPEPIPSSPKKGGKVKK